MAKLKYSDLNILHSRNTSVRHCETEWSQTMWGSMLTQATDRTFKANFRFVVDSKNTNTAKYRHFQNKLSSCGWLGKHKYCKVEALSKISSHKEKLSQTKILYIFVFLCPFHTKEKHSRPAHSSIRNRAAREAFRKKNTLWKDDTSSWTTAKCIKREKSCTIKAGAAEKTSWAKSRNSQKALWRNRGSALLSFRKFPGSLSSRFRKNL